MKLKQSGRQRTNRGNEGSTNDIIFAIEPDTKILEWAGHHMKYQQEMEDVSGAVTFMEALRMPSAPAVRCGKRKR